MVNGNRIYNLTRNQPVVIDMPTNPTRIVVSDGYHMTHPINLVYTVKPVRYYTIACVVEDAQLLVGFILMGIVYAMGLTSGIIFLQLLSVMPIVYLMYVYYFRRRKFIRIHSL